MIEYSATLQGWDQLDKALAQVPQSVERKAMRKALTDGSRVLLKETKALAPKDTGFLRRDLKAFIAKKKQNGVVRSIVGIPRKATAKSRQNVATGKVRYAGAWYAMLINYGFRTKNGRFIQGTHFMNRAFEAKKAQVIDIAEKEFAATVFKEILRTTT